MLSYMAVDRFFDSDLYMRERLYEHEVPMMDTHGVQMMDEHEAPLMGEIKVTMVDDMGRMEY